MRRVDMIQPSLPSLRWFAERVWSVEHAFERVKAAGRVEEDTRIRIFFAMAAFTFAFGLLAVGATSAALFSGAGTRGGWSAAAVASRADLVDRNGRLLATNLVHYGLYIEPNEIWDAAETRRALLAAVPELNVARLQKALNGDRRVFVSGGLTPAQKEAIHALGLPGVSFEQEDRRVYPLGSTAAHLIGFSDTGGRGLSGAERALDDEIREAGMAGRPVMLSIDLRVQGALENELQAVAAEQRAKGAVGLVTDVHTGEILALASWPSFDPNAPGAGGADAALNRAAASVYEMGSTFKVFSVAIGLDTGTASMASTFDARGDLSLGSRRISDYHAENRVMTLPEVFMHSSNIGTSMLALQVGGERMASYFDSLGLTAPAPIELVESARPIRPRRWNADTIASASFGHAISVSPLTLAAAMGAVLNGGRYVPLTIRKIEPGAAPAGRRVVSEGTSRAMLDLMRMNVVQGTGGKADAAGLRVGGKTGSAEKVIGGRYDRTRLVSSFAAVFPTDGQISDPRYFVLILVDEPAGAASTFGLRTGGWVAAPPTGRIINRIAPFLGVERKADPWRTATGEKIPQIEDIQSGGAQ